jgi:Lar family restriction alleviation protein
MRKIKLKPCPFCGGKEYLREYYDFGRFIWGIECSKCSCKLLEDFDTKEEAITKWNERVK